MIPVKIDILARVVLDLSVIRPETVADPALEAGWPEEVFSLYAVVESGGKQYRVAPGQKVRVDRLEGEIGSEVRLDRVLVLVDDQNQLIAGTPVVEGASVTARIVEQHRTRKVLVFKYAKRKRRRVKTGHRQYYTALHIGEILK